MVIWGVIWGALLGYLTGQYDQEFMALVGAMAGAVAGLTMRRAVRSEIMAQLAASQALQTSNTQTTHVTRAPMAQRQEPWERDLAEQNPSQHIPPKPVDEWVARDEEPKRPATKPALAVEQPQGFAFSHRPARPVPPDLLTSAVKVARDWLFGGNTIVRMGVLVLFVGLAFLAKFAMDNALLPPELRLAGVGLTGIALFVFGFRLRTRNAEKLAYALTLQGAGVGVLYLTVFAAFRMYQFIPSGAAFGVLALICLFSTVIALLQNSMAMAFIGFAGAFAAPLLVSTGQGNHVGLFSYYLLLNVAIAGVAWMRAWRVLNLLGFFSTFGVATAWGVLKYRPELLGSTEPFLLAFFLIYVVASLLYATRHSLAPKQAVDATLIFGNPLVAFGLQVGLVRDVTYAPAFSALAMGAFYLGLGWWALRRRQQSNDVGHWLAECFLALGLGFLTLAVPLALDGSWTSAVWATEGAAVYWMGQRQGRWLPRATGLALQVLAALSYLGDLNAVQTSNWPLANPSFIGAVMLAASAFALSHWSRTAFEKAGESPGTWNSRLAALENSWSPVLFLVGFSWWQFGLWQEIDRHVVADAGYWVPIFSNAMRANLAVLAWLGSAFVAHRLALPKRQKPWAIAATPAWFSLPIMVLFACAGIFSQDHVFQAGGWLVWPLVLFLHGAMMRGLDGGAPRRWWSWMHTGGVWLIVLLAGNLLVWSVQKAELHHTSWAAVILLVSGIGVLLILSRGAWFEADGSARSRWPLLTFADAYLWRAAMPLAVMVAIGSLGVALYSDGNARPLPYVPLLNPTDLSVGLGLAACALWLMRVRQSNLTLPIWARHARLPLVLIALAFIALNTVWLRVAHQYFAVPWDAGTLFDSFLVQAGYSILWTLLALGLMVAAHRTQARAMWTGGAALLALTLLKLFLIDLSNRGGSERIVVFIAVGVLMLVVGYFAPIPPPTTHSDLPSDGNATNQVPA